MVMVTLDVEDQLAPHAGYRPCGDPLHCEVVHADLAQPAVTEQRYTVGVSQDCGA
jgi:hypothetical protein